MDKEFKVNIYTTDKPAIKENVIEFFSEGVDGHFQILCNFNNEIIATVETKTILKKSDGTSISLKTSPGIILFKDNSLKFCCDFVDVI